jgi:hypothetical protein
MQLTHFGHSCLLASFKDAGGDETTVLFDPGNFSHGFEGITGLTTPMWSGYRRCSRRTRRLRCIATP